MESLTYEPTIELPLISSDYRQAGDDLFRNLGNISSQVNKINKEIKSSKSQLLNDVQAISNQVLNIFNFLIRSREEAGISEYIEDKTEEDPNTPRSGTVYKNQNYGSIHGSSNVGGIAGASYATIDISNNYYVHDTIAAVDGISYTNQASPLTYDELLKVEDLPTAFSKFYLTFMDDNEPTINGNKVLEAWNVELIGLQNEGEILTLRLLMPETKRKITVWQRGDNGWERLETSIKGSYIVFLMSKSKKDKYTKLFKLPPSLGQLTRDRNTKLDLVTL